MKKILVTGASGFIGRHVIAPLFAQGFDVHTIQSSPPVLRAVAHKADLMNPDDVAAVMKEVKPTHLLHLAWYAEPGKFWNAPENHDWVKATLNIYKSFVAAGGKRFIGAGTCAEYDWNFQRLDEIQTPCKPHTLYGVSKDGVHKSLIQAAKADHISLAWGRVFFLYGPHEKRGRLVSDVTASLLADQKVQTTEGTQIRDFMHVADVAGAFAALCNSDVDGPVNIASGDVYPLRDILGKIGELTGKSDLIEFGARPMPPNDPPALIPNVVRLKNEVGFTPRYDLDSGLKETVTWWQQNKG